jgi:hypothetical protein
VWRFYYYAGGTRVAEREATSGGETLYYLLGDHLGSTSITADSSGNKVAELRYKAWGKSMCGRYVGCYAGKERVFTVT